MQKHRGQGSGDGVGHLIHDHCSTDHLPSPKSWLRNQGQALLSGFQGSFLLSGFVSQTELASRTFLHHSFVLLMRETNIVQFRSGGWERRAESTKWSLLITVPQHGV